MSIIQNVSAVALIALSLLTVIASKKEEGNNSCNSLACRAGISPVLYRNQQTEVEQVFLPTTKGICAVRKDNIPIPR